jgi:hypothetical protein
MAIIYCNAQICSALAEWTVYRAFQWDENKRSEPAFSTCSRHYMELMMEDQHQVKPTRGYFIEKAN